MPPVRKLDDTRSDTCCENVSVHLEVHVRKSVSLSINVLISTSFSRRSTYEERSATVQSYVATLLASVHPSSFELHYSCTLESRDESNGLSVLCCALPGNVVILSLQPFA